jgi:hypothetical protein
MACRPWNCSDPAERVRQLRLMAAAARELMRTENANLEDFVVELRAAETHDLYLDRNRSPADLAAAQTPIYIERGGTKPTCVRMLEADPDDLEALIELREDAAAKASKLMGELTTTSPTCTAGKQASRPHWRARSVGPPPAARSIA